MKNLLSLLVLTVLCGSSAFSQTSRTWTGSTSTAWGTASNWSPSGVPATIDHVAIPNTTNKPKLSANVTIANFSITGGELDLDGDTLTVNGTLSMTGGVVKDGLLTKSGSGAITITGVTVECVLGIAGNTLSISDSRFRQEASVTRTGSVTGNGAINGNIWEAHARITNNSTAATVIIGSTKSDTFLTHLDVTNGGVGLFLGIHNNSHAVVLAGTGLQDLTVSGTVNGRRVVVDKPTGLVRLHGEFTASHHLHLTNGIVQCASGAQVTFNNSAVVYDASNDSYIEGPVLKKGNQAFTFPVGRNGHYRPISITAPTTSTHSFKAEYFESNSDPLYSHSSKDGSLNHLSKNEYWTLTRVVGSSTPKVTLSWDTLTSCIMNTPLSAIHVAGWNGSQWKDLGNGATTGNIHKGTIETTAAVTSFNAFILEHDNAMSLCGREVDFDWSPSDPFDAGDNITFTNTSTNFPAHYKYVWAVDDCWSVGHCGDTTIFSTTFVRAFGWGQRKVTLHVLNTMGFVVQSKSVSFKVLPVPPTDLLECNCIAPECDFVGNGTFNTWAEPVTEHNSLYNAHCWARNPDDPYYFPEECPPLIWTCGPSGEEQFQPAALIGNLFTYQSPANDFSIPSNLYTASQTVYEPGLSSTNANSAYSLVRTWGQEGGAFGADLHRTYLMSQMADRFNQGQMYQVTFDARLSQRSQVAEPIQVGFVNEEVCGVPVDGQRFILGSDFPDIQTLSFQPSGSFLTGFTQWHECSATFAAEDDWEWLYIGNFSPQVDAISWQTNAEPLYVEHTGFWWPLKESSYFIDNVSITAVPPTITQGPAVSVCQTDLPLTLNVTGSGTGSNIYTWSASPADASLAGQTHDMEIEVSPVIGTTTYTVTVEGPDGCELTDEIVVTVYGCCEPGKDPVVFNETFPFTVNPGLIITGTGEVIEGQSFTVNGPWQLNGDLILDNCTVSLGPDAQITVATGVTFKITGSHLFACDEMWEKILAESGSTISIGGNSIIEDAEFAVQIEDGATYKFQDTKFNRNHIHLFFSPNTNTSYEPIEDCHFLCQTTASLSGSPVHTDLLAPRTGENTSIGILATGTGALHVGVEDHGNVFDNANMGVFAMTVGEVNVSHNAFTDMTTVGVYVAWDSGENGGDIDIIDNVLNRMTYGIYCYDNPEAEIKIEGNNIDFTGMSSPPQYMTGITVEEITPGSPPSAPNKVSIHDNDIALAPCGIRVDNLAGYLLVPSTYIGFNRIYNEKTHNDEQAGILVENSSGVIVTDNTVKHNSKSGYETGIRIGGGNTNWLFCNTVEDLNKGLFFDNDQRPFTLLVQNIMDNTQTGIFLNNAKIGDQGSLSQAQDNEWLGTYTMFPNPHNPHTETYGLDADGVDSKFFVRNTGTLNPTQNAFTNFAPNPISTQIVTTAWSSGCPFTAPSYKTEEEQTPDVSSALSILNTTGEPQTLREASIRWAGEYGLYRQLLADETMRYADESLSAFFNEKEVGNMGKLHRALTDFNPLRHSNGSDLLSANVSEQLSVVNGLSSENHVEQRLGEVLGILYANIDDLKAIGGYEEARLREIAQLCPLDDGFGVYIARSALLKLDTLPHHYMNECERMPAAQSMEGWKTSQTEVKEFSVYPNPNNGSFAISYQLNDSETGTVHLFNVLGHVVYQAQLDASATVLNLSIGGLSSGIYILRVDVNGEHRLVERISVLSTSE